MKYKNIASAAHNFARSFASSVNWAEGDYVMSHLLRIAARSGINEFRVALPSGSVSPAGLLSTELVRAVEAKATDFSHQIASQRLDPACLARAVMTLHFDLARLRRLPRPGQMEAPYECSVEITDDRDCIHLGVATGAWGTDEFSETPSNDPALPP